MLQETLSMWIPGTPAADSCRYPFLFSAADPVLWLYLVWCFHRPGGPQGIFIGSVHCEPISMPLFDNICSVLEFYLQLPSAVVVLFILNITVKIYFSYSVQCRLFPVLNPPPVIQLGIQHHIWSVSATSIPVVSGYFLRLHHWFPATTLYHVSVMSICLAWWEVYGSFMWFPPQLSHARTHPELQYIF
jgi:hypothetical protein